MEKSSCLAFGARIYYRPIEAAVRWAGLLRFEPRILETLGPRAMPEPNDFPRWPLLRLFSERIFDALAHDELSYGKAGMAQEPQRPALDDPALIVRHVDLKAWMSHYYPGERPPFLFGNRSLSGVLCPPAPTRNNPSHIHQGGAGSDQGDSDQQQVAAA